MKEEIDWYYFSGILATHFSFSAAFFMKLLINWSTKCLNSIAIRQWAYLLLNFA